MTLSVTLPWPPKDAIGRSTQNHRYRWTEQETLKLTSLYEEAGSEGFIDLQGFAESIGRNKANVCRKARSMGLPVNQRRKGAKERKPPKKAKYATKEERGIATAEWIKRHQRENGHPRGMAGKSHSKKTRDRLAETTRARWRALTEQEKADFTLKAMKGKVLKGNSLAGRNPRGSWKAGWREIGDHKKYYRSRWEANYARWLQFLKQQGEIVDWVHEPDTFWFEEVKRGVRSYLPDFKIWENDGSIAYHEVKGWMDSRSKTCISRMKKYYPDVTLIVIGERHYRKIERQASHLCWEWEY